VTGVNPLRVYLYKEGLARFATETYEKPSKSTLNNIFQHLTNYAINKDNPEFTTDSEKTSHKRTFSQVLEHFKNLGFNTDILIN
jgi:tubulin polyglutamylase TTLL6/13